MSHTATMTESSGNSRQPEYAVEAHGLTKKYGGNLALQGVSSVPCPAPVRRGH